MANHPNRRAGRPPLPAGEGRQTLTVRVAPDIIAALPAAGEGRTAVVERILRAALIG